MIIKKDEQNCLRVKLPLFNYHVLIISSKNIIKQGYQWWLSDSSTLDELKMNDTDQYGIRLIQQYQWLFVKSFIYTSEIRLLQRCWKHRWKHKSVCQTMEIHIKHMVINITNIETCSKLLKSSSETLWFMTRYNIDRAVQTWHSNKPIAINSISLQISWHPSHWTG